MLATISSNHKNEQFKNMNKTAQIFTTTNSFEICQQFEEEEVV